MTKDTLCRMLTIVGLIFTFFLPLIFMLLLNTEIFPTTYLGFTLNDPSLSHPFIPDTISGVFNAAVYTIVVCVVAAFWLYLKHAPLFQKMDIKSKFFWYGLGVGFAFYGCVIVNLVTNFVKHYRGGLRPHFFAICELNETIVEKLEKEKVSYVNESMSKVICTSNHDVDYRWSFPSGHTSGVVYGMLLSMYLIGDIKCDVVYNPIKAFGQTLLAMFACFVAVSRLVDYHHHWWDVLAGGVLGALVALATYYWFLKPLDDALVTELKKKNDDTETIKDIIVQPSENKFASTHITPY